LCKLSLGKRNESFVDMFPHFEYFGLYNKCIFICVGTEGVLAWHDNWVSFLDSMLHMDLIAKGGRELRLPTRISSLRIDPVGHEKIVTTLEDGARGMVVLYCALLNEIKYVSNVVCSIGQ